jgi:murein DD-endopeptidase MepM/ murein hydrolase activator NlpD
MPSEKPHRAARFLLAVLFLLFLLAGYQAYRWFTAQGNRTPLVLTWLRDPGAHPEWAIQAGRRCGQAPFLHPTDGFIGYLWGDSFRPGYHHQGLDIFGGDSLNQTPVVAAYPGYLTRLPEWKSAVIIRIPDDPLHPGRQIWIYYAHMADPDGNSFISPEFPAGTNEVFVEAGTLLGYQGNYSGDPFNPVGIHLHFSLVLDDGQGRFRNELEIQNTLDPSPYLGLPVNAQLNHGEVPVCD